MVEAAIEFADICRQNDFHNFVFSMKASNPLVMVQAYRLLAAEQYRLGWDYPLHLGVTEAGEGEDGRMKSAIGAALPPRARTRCAPVAAAGPARVARLDVVGRRRVRRRLRGHAAADGGGRSRVVHGRVGRRARGGAVGAEEHRA